jgi:predicted metal-dependent phosphoesterase TrpH
MKADLHFHPSFFSRGDRSRKTEGEAPTLTDIQRECSNKDLSVVTITSHSWTEHIDKRWGKYMEEMEEDSNVEQFNITPLTTQAIMFQDKYDDASDPRYLIHGQELKTDKADVNILFADQRVPVEKTNGKLEEVVRAARDSGNNVLVSLPHPSHNKLTVGDIRALYKRGIIDIMESFSSLDLLPYNNLCKAMTEKVGIPGIAVSDGHRLVDMGKAHIYTETGSLPNMSYSALCKFVGSKIKEGEFKNHEESSSMRSRFLYGLRLAEVVISSP